MLAALDCHVDVTALVRPLLRAHSGCATPASKSLCFLGRFRTGQPLRLFVMLDLLASQLATMGVFGKSVALAAATQAHEADLLRWLFNKDADAKFRPPRLAESTCCADLESGFLGLRDAPVAASGGAHVDPCSIFGRNCRRWKKEPGSVSVRVAKVCEAAKKRHEKTLKKNWGEGGANRLSWKPGGASQRSSDRRWGEGGANRPSLKPGGAAQLSNERSWLPGGAAQLSNDVRWGEGGANRLSWNPGGAAQLSNERSWPPGGASQLSSDVRWGEGGASQLARTNQRLATDAAVLADRSHPIHTDADATWTEAQNAERRTACPLGHARAARSAPPSRLSSLRRHAGHPARGHRRRVRTRWATLSAQVGAAPAPFVLPVRAHKAGQHQRNMQRQDRRTPTASLLPR